jgi:hypothetical protein
MASSSIWCPVPVTNLIAWSMAFSKGTGLVDPVE